MPEAGTKTIRRGEGNTIGINNILIPFNCLYDLDVGLIKLVRSEFRSSSMFNLELLDSFEDDKALILNLYNRKDENPLIQFMNEPNKDVANDLYGQFIEKEYENIISLSPKTGIFDLTKLFFKAEEINLSIYYTKDIELETLKNDLLVKYKINTVDPLDINKTQYSFSEFFVRDAYDPFFKIILRFARLASIYLLDYRYNFSEDIGIIPTDYIISTRIARCQLYIINAYNLSKLQ